MAAVEAFNPFIISTDVQKTDAKTRKLIRSHVMLGKNRGKRRPNRQRPENHEGNTVTESSSLPSTSDEDVRPVVPTKVGNEYSLLKLAAEVEPVLIQPFLQFASQAKANLFPLEPCIAFHNHQRQWIAPVTHDPLFLHATIFASQAAFRHGSSRDTDGSVVSQYFGKTVAMLRHRLEQDDPATRTSDTTLTVVIILAMSALLSGQEETARYHMAGVKRMVELRGGFASFGEAVKLLIEVLRCDIGLTLSTGQPPFFFHRPVSGPQTAHVDEPCASTYSAKSGQLGTLLSSLDPKLSHIRSNLCEFCKKVNTASKTYRRLSEQMFLDNMASNVYPLLNLRFGTGTLSETSRLGLLAFCSNAFLQWQGMKVNYKSLPSMYRQSLLGLGQGAGTQPPQVMLWLLMMGGIALFTGVEDQSWLLPWLQDSIKECALFGWEAVRDVLKPFMWVDFIHDGPGERLYAAAMAHGVS